MTSLIVALVCVVAAPSASILGVQPSQSTIKKADGNVVAGTISGLVILKDLTIKTDGAKQTHSATYYLLNGRSIESITEEGVKYASTTVGTCTVSQEVPFDDLDVLGVCAGMSGSSPLEMGFTKQGGSVVKMGLVLNRAPTYRSPLLGEFRKGSDGFQLLPALDIVTTNGTVTVPVTSVVRFKASVGLGSSSRCDLA